MDKAMYQRLFTAEGIATNSSSSTQHMCELYCRGDMTVCFKEVLAMPWVGECVPLALHYFVFLIATKLLNIQKRNLEKIYFMRDS